MKFNLHPVTLRRLRQFRHFRRAWWSFWILLSLYAISLGAELVSNSRPYTCRINGRTFYPILFNYTQDDLLSNGVPNRPNYHAIQRQFPDAVMRFPPVPYGPFDSVKPEDLQLPRAVTINFRPVPGVWSVDMRPDGTTARPATDERLIGIEKAITNLLKAALRARFANQESADAQASFSLVSGEQLTLSVPAFLPRAASPKSVRVTVREMESADREQHVLFAPDLEGGEKFWMTLPPEERTRLSSLVEQRFERFVENTEVAVSGTTYRVLFQKEDVRFPFRPIARHPFGLDSSGRDVLARVIYGFRTSISFGLLLVVAAMTLGTLIGGMQGYRGGAVDLLGQRVTEIWENLPFLYVIMLLGSVFGRSLALLLICYGIFNWIGISYYMRAEFLKLRKQPFVEGAMALGLSSRVIMFRHILPNALVPIITFAPFSLIGAVSSLAALDFLGFGLPPPAPSWGELLAQAQEFKWAWWLVVYPGLALTLVILLCVFIGEGVRAAFDPRRFSRFE